MEPDLDLSELTELTMSEDEEEDSSDDDDSMVLKISTTLRKPRTENWAISDICRQIASGKIDLDPEYQRDVVWPDVKQSALIDSLFHHFYVPPIVVANNPTKGGKRKRICIDGKQRLTSIQRFKKGEIPYKDSVTGKKYWYTRGGKSSSRGILSMDDRQQFDEIHITIIEYDDLTDAQEREIFQRVQNGMALRPQERLQALTGPYPALLHNALSFIRNSPSGTSSLPFLNQDARGKNFEALAQVFYLVTHPRDPKIPTVPTLSTWINSSTGSQASKHEKEFEGTLEVFFDLGITVQRRVDFVFVLFFVHVWKASMDVQQLTKGVEVVRKRLGRNQVGSVEFKKMIRFVSTLGLTDRSKGGIEGVVGDPAEGQSPAWPRKGKAKETLPPTPPRPSSDSHGEKVGPPRKRRKVIARQLPPESEESDDDRPITSLLKATTPRLVTSTSTPQSDSPHRGLSSGSGGLNAALNASFDTSSSEPSPKKVPQTTSARAPSRTQVFVQIPSIRVKKRAVEEDGNTAAESRHGHAEGPPRKKTKAPGPLSKTNANTTNETSTKSLRREEASTKRAEPTSSTRAKPPAKTTERSRAVQSSDSRSKVPAPSRKTPARLLGRPIPPIHGGSHPALARQKDPAATSAKNTALNAQTPQSSATTSSSTSRVVQKPVPASALPKFKKNGTRPPTTGTNRDMQERERIHADTVKLGHTSLDRPQNKLCNGPNANSQATSRSTAVEGTPSRRRLSTSSAIERVLDARSYPSPATPSVRQSSVEGACDGRQNPASNASATRAPEVTTEASVAPLRAALPNASSQEDSVVRSGPQEQRIDATSNGLTNFPRARSSSLAVSLASSLPHTPSPRPFYDDKEEEQSNGWGSPRYEPGSGSYGSDDDYNRDERGRSCSRGSTSPRSDGYSHSRRSSSFEERSHHSSQLESPPSQLNTNNQYRTHYSQQPQEYQQNFWGRGRGRGGQWQQRGPSLLDRIGDRITRAEEFNASYQHQSNAWQQQNYSGGYYNNGYRGRGRGWGRGRGRGRGNWRDAPQEDEFFSMGL